MAVIRLDPTRRDAAAQVYARAFFDYPAMTVTWPERESRQRYLPWYLGCALQYGLLYGEVYTTPELAGIAVWLPAGHTEVTTWGAIRAGFLRTPLRLGLRQFFRARKYETAAMAAHQEIMQRKPHWYVWGLAVDPARQRQGIGSTLLQDGLKRVDALGMPCYLETHAEQNLRFYEKAGFEMVRRVEMGESKVTFWCMVRQAQGRV